MHFLLLNQQCQSTVKNTSEIWNGMVCKYPFISGSFDVELPIVKKDAAGSEMSVSKYSMTVICHILHVCSFQIPVHSSVRRRQHQMEVAEYYISKNEDTKCLVKCYIDATLGNCTWLFGLKLLKVTTHYLCCTVVSSFSKWFFHFMTKTNFNYVTVLKHIVATAHLQLGFVLFCVFCLLVVLVRLLVPVQVID